VDAAGTTDASGVTIKTTSPAVARGAVRLWRSEFGLSPRLTTSSTGPFGRPTYAVRVEGEEALAALRALRGGQDRLRRGSPAGNAYLRGAFQGAGSVTGPQYRRGHHLEFVHGDEAFVRRVAALSRARLKVAERRGRHVAYTKSADGLTELLAQMGLDDAVLQYEARAVVGEAKANANRATNFDSANAARTARAADRQAEALRALDPEALPLALREMLELRLENPDASLTELAQLGGLSKSAANHRLRRLVELGRERSAGAVGRY
jgi:DNA-binding protein WhiA